MDTLKPWQQLLHDQVLQPAVGTTGLQRMAVFLKLDNMMTLLPPLPGQENGDLDTIMKTLDMMLSLLKADAYAIIAQATVAVLRDRTEFKRVLDEQIHVKTLPDHCECYLMHTESCHEQSLHIYQVFRNEDNRIREIKLREDVGQFSGTVMSPLMGLLYRQIMQ